jgi:hypothetical protein
MAEEKEVFHTLKDSNGDGEAPDLVNQGDNITAADGQLVFVGWDQAGNAQAIEQVAEGDPVLTAANISVFTVKDPSGNAQYLKTDASGALIITDEGAKTPYSAFGEVTVTTAAVEQLVIELQTHNGSSEKYDDIEILPSSSKDCKWNIYGVDDISGTPVETLLYSMRSKADHSEPVVLSCLNHSSGSTGQQGFRVKVLQKSGSGADASAFICVKSSG